MPLSEFRSARSWQEAIDLGPSLVLLAEQLPASEQMGLSWQLQKAMVDLPKSVAVDLMEDGSNERRASWLRLAATLDLVEKIYPALDTAAVRDEADRLGDRLMSDRFAESIPGSGPAPAVAADMAPAPAAITPPVPAASVPVIPESSASPDGEPVLMPVAVPAQAVAVAGQDPDEAPQENHVRPDSVQ